MMQSAAMRTILLVSAVLSAVGGYVESDSKKQPDGTYRKVIARVRGPRTKDQLAAVGQASKAKKLAASKLSKPKILGVGLGPAAAPTPRANKMAFQKQKA